MIVLDTHVWIWLVNNSVELGDSQRRELESHRRSGLIVPVISIWEVAKLVEKGRLVLSIPVSDWLAAACAQPGIVVAPMTVAVAVESTILPAPFHKDPADQLIVATARSMALPLATADGLILAYEHVDKYVVTRRSSVDQR